MMEMGASKPWPDALEAFTQLYAKYLSLQIIKRL